MRRPPIDDHRNATPFPHPPSLLSRRRRERGAFGASNARKVAVMIRIPYQQPGTPTQLLGMFPLTTASCRVTVALTF